MTKLCSHGKTCNNEKTELYIHGKDGKIHSKDNHGSEPNPPDGEDNVRKSNEISQDFCYNEFTFPPIFRDGVRGGYAASAVLIGG